MDRTAAWRVACLVGVVALAGCAGIGAEPRTATLSPAPVPPTATLTDTPESGPHSGFWDATPVQTHIDSLEDTSYTYTRSVRYEGPHTLAHDRVVSVGPNGTTHATVHMHGTGVLQSVTTSLSLWSDGHRTFGRDVQAHNRTVRLDTSVIRTESGVPGTDLLDSVFASANLTTDIYYRAASAFSTDSFSLEYTGPLRTLENARNATVNFRIAQAGVIERMDLAFTATIEGDPVDVRVIQEVSAIGNTTVSRPQWVPGPV